MTKVIVSCPEPDGSYGVYIGVSGGVVKTSKNGINHFKIGSGLPTTSPVGITITRDGTLLCVSLNNKTLVCWNTGSEAPSSTFVVKKQVTSLTTYRFSEASSAIKDVLIYADKTGDVWGTRIPALSPVALLVGHTASVVTAIDVNSTNTLLATADRDEKIRISSLPITEKIVGYLLGHNSVITAVQFFVYEGIELLASVSWDHRLLIWSLETFTILAEYAFAVAAKPAAVSEESKVDLAAAEDQANFDEEIVDDDEDPNRYDEAAAGNYPFALAVDESGCICVLSKNLNKLTTLRLGGRQESLQLQAVSEITTPSVPLDLCALSNGVVAVLLSYPHSLQYYNNDGLDITSELVGGATLEQLVNIAGIPLLIQIIVYVDGSFLRGQLQGGRRRRSL